MHHIGLARSPFHSRRVLSSSSNTFSFSSPSSPSPSVNQTAPTQDDRTQDNKDVLLERLNDLVLRLIEDEDLADDTVSAIHREVDSIEKHIREQRRRPRLAEVARMEQENYWVGGGKSPGPAPHRHLHSSAPGSPSSQRGSRRSGRGRLNSGIGLGLVPGFSPSQSQDVDLQRLGDVDGEEEDGEEKQEKGREAEMSSAKVAELARLADELAEQLGATVAELIARKEESDHIHDLLATRAGQATERNLFLEYKIAEMEDDFSANQSELKFLRIQLQALEAQCSPYIPQNEDQELSESIMNWKIDWEDINRKSRARRRKAGIAVPPELSRNPSSEIPLRRDFRIMDVVSGEGYFE